MPTSPSRALPLLLPLLLSLALGCGGDGPECVIDTDCALGFRCASSGSCQRVGEVPDAGGSDAGSDAAVADAGSRDAQVDAGAPSCAEVTPGTYVVQEPFVGCAFASGAQVRVRAAAAACSWVVEPLGADNVIDGTFSIDEAGVLTATDVTVEGLGVVTCSGTFRAEPLSLTFSCPPDCVITLVPPG